MDMGTPRYWALKPLHDFWERSTSSDLKDKVKELVNVEGQRDLEYTDRLISGPAYSYNLTSSELVQKVLVSSMKEHGTYPTDPKRS